MCKSFNNNNHSNNKQTNTNNVTYIRRVTRNRYLEQEKQGKPEIARWTEIFKCPKIEILQLEKTPLVQIRNLHLKTNIKHVN